MEGPSDYKKLITDMKSETLSIKSILLQTLSWVFGVIAFAIGLVNLFWGNDPGFGIFIIVLSIIYFPPLTSIFTQKTGLSIPGFVKFLIAVFILWASLGVGELFDKLELMTNNL
jgi:hypothetical protein